MSILKNINSPEDLKKLEESDLKNLSSEIREFLINSISKTGGHLASNLGVVELTIALHYCFSSPRDKIIWDVGHQAYVHKILTGRKEMFDTLRSFNGISGFPKPKESIHDIFGTGHSSTSISAALGMASARDLLEENNDYSVIAVIGDGSMTGGLAYEALNNAGRTNTNLIVILNDNEMSITENVGAMSRHLSDIRIAPTYINAKNGFNKFLKKIPTIGEKTGSLIEKTKDTIKYMLVPGIMFEEMGFQYVGPINGQNLNELIKVYNKVKNMQGPILIHVMTKKGKGYKIAEKNPSLYHGVGKFDIKTGTLPKNKDSETYSDVFGKTLVKLATMDKKIVAISAAMISGTGLESFKKIFPKRTFDVGIAEEHAITFSAGMATNGFIPFVAIYSTFLQRGYDQILHDVCIQNLHVVFAIDRAGIVGEDGETHQGIYDISFLSHIPNLTIMAPKDRTEFIEMIKYAANFNGPIGIRYPKGNPAEFSSDGDFKPIEYGKFEVIEEGSDIVLIYAGSMAQTAMKVADNLKQNGVCPTIINARFLKPIDESLLLELSKKNKYIFTMEENIRSGGFGSKILEFFSDKQVTACSVINFALPNTFIEHGNRNLLLEKYLLDEKSITDKILFTLNL